MTVIGISKHRLLWNLQHYTTFKRYGSKKKIKLLTNPSQLCVQNFKKEKLVDEEDKEGCCSNFFHSNCIATSVGPRKREHGAYSYCYNSEKKSANKTYLG